MACGATLKRTLDFDPLLSPASPKRRRCAPLSASAAAASSSSAASFASSPQKYLRMEPSPFGEVSTRLTTEQILYNIKQEYKRMQKRRHLENFQQTDPCCSTDAQSQAFLLSGPALPGTSSVASSPLKKEQPLFTLRQVGMICERLLKEREEKIREEYEEILTTKLAEQYDAFVKFTHDQIMRRYGEQPASYVS
ncbi:akirin-2 [Varanus komodoensis]|uniref:Akirin-2 n=1 Tax=Varanus komodoensis TaxID=61221 RepID=A0A8D2PZJ9_VARKO|nr:akirin-2 [Varanus komodoensis]